MVVSFLLYYFTSAIFILQNFPCIEVLNFLDEVFQYSRAYNKLTFKGTIRSFIPFPTLFLYQAVYTFNTKNSTPPLLVRSRLFLFVHLFNIQTKAKQVRPIWRIAHYEATRSPFTNQNTNHPFEVLSKEKRNTTTLTIFSCRSFILSSQLINNKSHCFGD